MTSHPVFQMSSFSRSGETLMQRCLQAHPDRSGRSGHHGRWGACRAARNAHGHGAGGRRAGLAQGARHHSTTGDGACGRTAGHGRRRDSHRGWRGRCHAQHLAHLDRIGVGQVVPGRHVAPVLTRIQRDAEQGVAGFDGHVTGLACVFCTGHDRRFCAREPALVHRRRAGHTPRGATGADQQRHPQHREGQCAPLFPFPGPGVARGLQCTFVHEDSTVDQRAPQDPEKPFTLNASKGGTVMQRPILGAQNERPPVRCAPRRWRSCPPPPGSADRRR